VQYFANPSTPPVREAMQRGELAMIATPKQGNRLPDGVEWCADNGCFGKGYPGDDAWFAWLESFTVEQRARCAFAVAPDVVGDATATRARSTPWLERIRALGYPPAFVAQNGAEHVGVPWDGFDVLFLGGDTEWKLGRHARALVAEARARGKRVHMGRVNSARRMRYAAAIGCDTADGTYIAFGPDTNLPDVLAWLRGVNDTPALIDPLHLTERSSA
jgi:hypothetical protein